MCGVAGFFDTKKFDYEFGKTVLIKRESLQHWT